MKAKATKFWQVSGGPSNTRGLKAARLQDKKMTGFENKAKLGAGIKGKRAKKMGLGKNASLPTEEANEDMLPLSHKDLAETSAFIDI